MMALLFCPVGYTIIPPPCLHWALCFPFVHCWFEVLGIDGQKETPGYIHTFYPLECDAEHHQHTYVLFKMPLKWRAQEMWQWG